MLLTDTFATADKIIPYLHLNTLDGLRSTTYVMACHNIQARHTQSTELNAKLSTKFITRSSYMLGNYKYGSLFFTIINKFKKYISTVNTFQTYVTVTRLLIKN